MIKKISDYVKNPRKDYAGVTQYNLDSNVEIQVRHFLHTVVYGLSHDYIYKPQKGFEISEDKKKALTQDITNFAKFVTSGANGTFRAKTKFFNRILYLSMKKEAKNVSRKNLIKGLWNKRKNIQLDGFDKPLKKLMDNNNINYNESLLI